MGNNYDPKNCQSLFGYGKAAHERSGGICEYCGLGASELDFDIWRQFSVDHVIPARLLHNIRDKFPRFDKKTAQVLEERINRINLVTACNFCNSMTSRMPFPVDDILCDDRFNDVTSIEDESVQSMLRNIELRVQNIKAIKRIYVQERLAEIRSEFRKNVEPMLLKSRVEMEVPHFQA